jgi:hypothetical protein
LDQQLNENGLNLENKENFNSSFGLKVAVCVVDQKQEEIVRLRNENAKVFYMSSSFLQLAFGSRDLSQCEKGKKVLSKLSNFTK